MPVVVKDEQKRLSVEANPKSSDPLSVLVDCGSDFHSTKHFIYGNAKYVLG